MHRVYYDFLNFEAGFRRHSIDIGPKLVGSDPVGFEVIPTAIEIGQLSEIVTFSLPRGHLRFYCWNMSFLGLPYQKEMIRSCVFLTRSWNLWFMAWWSFRVSGWGNASSFSVERKLNRALFVSFHYFDISEGEPLSGSPHGRLDERTSFSTSSQVRATVISPFSGNFQAGVYAEGG